MPPLLFYPFIEQTTMTEQTLEQQDERRRALFEEAKAIGLTFSNNIGTDTLEQRIAEFKAQADESAKDAQDPDGVDDPAGDVSSESVTDTVPPAPTQDPAAFVNEQLKVTDVAPAPTVETTPPSRATVEDLDALPKTNNPAQFRQALLRRERRLVRVRIDCLNPTKADLNGEIKTVANEYIGNIKMFVPYGEVTYDGWHIPYAMYKMLKGAKYQHIRTYTDRATRQIKVETSIRPEFNIIILPALSSADLADLRASSAGQQ